MNEYPRPKNWQTAASLIIDATFDLARTEIVANCEDIDICFDSIVNEFDYLVSDCFNNDGYETDGIEEQLHDIAAYAMHGYAISASISKSAAVNSIFNTLVSKQKMYGPKNIEKFGLRGIIIRLNDKIERLKNLQQHQGPVIFEPIKDTWLDIVGYSVIAIMFINGWFSLPMKETSTSTSQS